MIYPYEMYLKALLLRGHDNNSIKYRLRAVRLAEPTDEDLEVKREELFELFPENTLVYVTLGNKYDLHKFLKMNKKRLKALGIDELIAVMEGERNRDWEDALLLITDKTYRIPIKTMLLSGNTTTEVLASLQESFNLDVDLEAVELFKKYFWETSKLTKLEMYHYISTVEGVQPRAIFMDAFHKKTERTSWRVTGENMLTLDAILTEVMNEAFDKFRASVYHDDDSTVAKTVKWAELAIKAAEKYSKLTQGDSKNAIEKLRFKLEKIQQADIKRPGDFDGEIV